MKSRTNNKSRNNTCLTHINHKSCTNTCITRTNHKSRTNTCITHTNHKSCTNTCITHINHKSCTNPCITRSNHKSCTNPCITHTNYKSRTNTCINASRRSRLYRITVFPKGFGPGYLVRMANRAGNIQVRNDKCFHFNRAVFAVCMYVCIHVKRRIFSSVYMCMYVRM